MRFLDRTEELRRLDDLASGGEGGLAMLWGRRRIGKTRLLVEWCLKQKGAYSVADQSAGPVQRRYMAAAFSEVFDGFDEVEYPDWRAFFGALSRAADAKGYKGPIVIDELPYLVGVDPTLPSVLQSWLDRDAKRAKLTVAFAGSAQHMMHGLALDADSPLFGRASQILKIGPIPAGHIGSALSIEDARDCLRAFAVLGGVPRYWELAAPFGRDVEAAFDELVMDPLGPLHNEPDRLLAIEVPSAMSLRPILDVIGAGAHRVSEIGGRLGQPATSLNRPLTRLMDLGYVEREIPFGASEKGTKKTLYKISDPFLRAWFRVVAPNRALLARAGKPARKKLWEKHAAGLCALAFEELCREAVFGLTKELKGVQFETVGRLWGASGPEWDVVARSSEDEALLLGEVKWSDKEADVGAVEAAIFDLRRKGVPRTVLGKKAENRIIQAVFFPALTKKAREHRFDALVVEGKSVLRALR